MNESTVIPPRTTETAVNSQIYYPDKQFAPCPKCIDDSRRENAAKKSLWHERRRTMSTQPQCGGDSGRSHPGRQEYARVRMTRALALALLLARSRSRSRSRALSVSLTLALAHSLARILPLSPWTFFARARAFSRPLFLLPPLAPARPRSPPLAPARPRSPSLACWLACSS